MPGEVNSSWRWWKLIWTAIGLSVLIAVTAIWFRMAPIEAEPPVTPASVSESISAAAAAPSADSFLAHAETVQQALNSGDDAGIRAILPLAGDEKPAPEFAQTIASLELVLDKSSQKTLAPDLWEVQANDKYGMSWTLGILQVDGTPKLMYAERTLP